MRAAALAALLAGLLAVLAVPASAAVVPPPAHPSSGFDGDGTPDLFAREVSGRLLLYPTTGDGGWRSPRTVGSGWAGFTALVKPGDFDGDDHNDVVARDSGGRLYLYPGDGHGGWLPQRQIGAGWNIFDLLAAPGDFNSDGTNDLLGRTPQGQLILYPGTGLGGFHEPHIIGTGWHSMDAIFSPGDIDGDRRNDILARERGTGILYAYFGGGGPAWASYWMGVRPIGHGWDALASVGSAGDFNGDGYPDVLGIDSAGLLHMYYFNHPSFAHSNRPWMGANVVGWGWAGFTAVF